MTDPLCYCVTILLFVHGPAVAAGLLWLPPLQMVRHWTHRQPQCPLQLLFSSNKATADAPHDNDSNGILAAFSKDILNSVDKDVTKTVREGAGLAVSVAGLYNSIASSLLTDKAQFHRWKPRVDALKTYLETSGLEEEISDGLNERLLENIRILSMLQKEALGGADRRDAVLSKQISWEDLPASWEEAVRYMRYATAAYGDPIIQAANVRVTGSFNFGKGELTKQRISEHVGIPEEDLVLVDVEYSGKANYLRHFIAVDHENRKVVLAIRGTYNLSEMLTDISGYSRPFCGGEAHSAIATLAEQLWEQVGDSVVEQLDSNEDYELIITGHSLGAGSSCLLNILLHQDGRRRVNGRKIRCFAYASPPVFTPLDSVPDAVQSAINYINQEDDVPFLSGDSVRHLFASIGVLEQGTKNMTALDRGLMVTGQKKPNKSVVDAALRANVEPLPEKEGVPVLAIPAVASVWMWEEQSSGKYDAKICDSLLLAKNGIYLDPDRITDHLPGRYEYALDNLEL